MAERIPIASDHAGFELKEQLKSRLAAMGFEVEDLGTHSNASTDYPDYAHAVAQQIESGAARRGILLCGTGLGMAYAANRHPHIRAAVAWIPEIATLARKHNDANVLALPARFVTATDGEAIVKAFLETGYEGGRHAPRVAKIELPDKT